MAQKQGLAVLWCYLSPEVIKKVGVVVAGVRKQVGVRRGVHKELRYNKLYCALLRFCMRVFTTKLAFSGYITI